MSWDGFWGVCFRDACHVEIFRPPLVPGLVFEQIDYAPMVRKRQVLDGGQWRDLTDAEVDAVDAVLARMVDGIEREVCGP
jgi:hypothetical protein